MNFVSHWLVQPHPDQERDEESLQPAVSDAGSLRLLLSVRGDPAGGEEQLLAPSHRPPRHPLSLPLSPSPEDGHHRLHLQHRLHRLREIHRSALPAEL